MHIDGKLPIATYAAELPGAIALFEAFGLDYACAGGRSLDDAAHAEGIAPHLVIAGLRRLSAVEHAESWSDRPLAELIAHLSTQHHRFVRDEMAAIALRLAEACGAPAAPPPDLVALRAAFTRLCGLVLPHLHREENEIFPAIAALESAWQADEPAAAAAGLAAELHRLTSEHGAISAQLRTMRELRLRLDASNELPPRARAVLDALTLLEAHLHEYIFLENGILFPRTAALEDPAAANAGR